MQWRFISSLWHVFIARVSDGMIMKTEISRRRIRSMNKLVRVGRTECVVVIRVDDAQGCYIYLVLFFSYGGLIT